jgi:LuxR family transcriptional regulator
MQVKCTQSGSDIVPDAVGENCIKSLGDIGYNNVGLLVVPVEQTDRWTQPSEAQESCIQIDNHVVLDTYPTGYLPRLLSGQLDEKTTVLQWIIASKLPIMTSSIWRNLDKGTASSNLSVHKNSSARLSVGFGFAYNSSIEGLYSTILISSMSPTVSSSHHDNLFRINLPFIRELMDGVEKSLSHSSNNRAIIPLTLREKEMLNYLANGDTALEIARKVGKSPHTVNKQIGSAKSRLNARTTAEAVSKAIRWKII